MYIQAQELTEVMSERALVELTCDSTRPTAVNQAVAEQACRYAAEMVDGYLRARYITPLATVPTLVRHICLQLARYWLYARRDNVKLPDNVKDPYVQALKDLERIQQGKLHLGLTEMKGGEHSDDSLPAPAKFRTRAATKFDLTGY